MKIKEGTLCVAKSIKRWVVITQKEKDDLFQVKTDNTDAKFAFREEDLIPFVENCGHHKTVNSAVQDNLPQILVNIILGFENKIDALTNVFAKAIRD